MSVFEDLIDELKNENLLEETVIDLAPAQPAATAAPAMAGEFELAPVPSSLGSAASAAAADAASPRSDKAVSEQEFFRKRAMDEVAGLQMVEHVFSGVERDFLQSAAEPFDDLNAKKALHKFLQVPPDPSTKEHVEAEFALRTEVEAWNLALSARDQKIGVSNLRRFCEECRPALSSSALIALARFYRNSPYSEDVRGKFDYVMTRLFSRESEDGRRHMLFEHDEMLGHINKLYADWSSIVLYTSKDDEAEISLTVTRFAEFIDEALRAGTFGEMLGSEFFNRLRSYKEESAEMFYVPEVLAAAMKCNLAVGNRYVELIALERNKRSAEKVEERYGSEFDQLVSDTAGRTLALSDVLTLDVDVAEDQTPKPAPAFPAQPIRPTVQSKESFRSRFDVFGINKWLLFFCVAVILAGAGVYIWAERFAGGAEADAAMAKPVEIEVPDAAKYLRNASFTNETLYAVAQPAFDNLTESERKEFLEKVRQFAASKNLPNVAVLNSEGRTIAFASKTRLELVAR